MTCLPKGASDSRRITPKNCGYVYFQNPITTFTFVSDFRFFRVCKVISGLPNQRVNLFQECVPNPHKTQLDVDVTIKEMEADPPVAADR